MPVMIDQLHSNMLSDCELSCVIGVYLSEPYSVHDDGAN